MKPSLSSFIITLAVLLTGLSSCKKETSCEGCKDDNKPPIAIAGQDKNISLPMDSVLLDGSASNDSDGTIIEWQWSKIAGPSSFNLRSQNTAQTIAGSLMQGVYLFEIKVTDNSGSTDLDTVQIIVGGQTNRPPIANAGPDQTMTLPNNSFDLDGSASSDPDNNIVSYLWTKISGPASFGINNSSSAQTPIFNLDPGIYKLELKVTDAGGLFDTDTVNITIASGCIAAGTRPIINAQLLPIGTLSQARAGIASGFASNKIVFAGGHSPAESGAVDIYDLTNNQWTSTQLSVPRSAIGVTTLGNKIFFAGGGYLHDEIFHSNIDVFDAINNSWSVLNLSNDRTNVTAVSVGEKIMFAGGWQLNNSNTSVISTAIMNVYNTSSTNWSLTNLPAAGAGIPAVTINDKVYFGLESKVQIYDNNNNSWSQWDLNYLTNPWTVSTLGNKTYWAGAGCTVEIKDITTGNSIAGTLSKPNVYKTVTKNGKVIFFHSGEYQATTFDIYDPVGNTWSIGTLSNGYLPAASAIISVNNEIYVAGGAIACISSSPISCTMVYTNQVWKLVF